MKLDGVCNEVVKRKIVGQSTRKKAKEKKMKIKSQEKITKRLKKGKKARRRK